MEYTDDLEDFLRTMAPRIPTAAKRGSLSLPEVVLNLASGATIAYMGESNVFYYGDNLSVMREMPSDSVDLIYLDPPFNSQRTYNVIFTEQDSTQSQAQRKAFTDYWRWGDEAQRALEDLTLPGGSRKRRGVPQKLSQTMEMLSNILGTSDMMAYLVMMASRLVEMRRLLKSTGSLYLHCDPTASHYLKLTLDTIFGPTNFRSEVIWKRSSSHNACRFHGPIHDTLLFYTKTDDYTWNPISARLPQKTVDQWYNNIEEGTGRRFNRADLTGSGTRGGDSGKPWRGIDPTAKGRHWAIPRSVEIVKEIVGDLPTLEALDALDDAGRIFWPGKEGGVPMFKRYIEEAAGVPALDVITSIRHLHNRSPERLGYGTQKPLELLKHLVELSSSPGDVVLDPFCGCGTTIEASQSLGRRWIGIDITHVAVSVLRRRLEGRFPDLEFRIYGEPRDFKSAQTLALSKPHGRFEFQAWFVDQVGGVPTDMADDPRVAKRGGDQGVDGWLTFRDDPKAVRSKRMVLSVKSDRSPHPDMVRELLGTVTATKAAAGALLLLHKPTKGMLETAQAAGSYTSDTFNPGDRYPKIQILTVQDLMKGQQLRFPGSNSTRKSVPPADVAGGTGDLFEWADANDLRKTKPPVKSKPSTAKGGVRRAYPSGDEAAEKEQLKAADSKKRKRR